MNEMTAPIRPSRKPRAVAIGAFDGVHLGHAAVVRPVLEAAERLGITSAALTFEPTPRQYFAGSEEEKQRLTLDEERRELLCRLGVRQILVQTFDEELRNMTPEQFAREVLCERLDARFVSIGASHTFGSRRTGGPEEIAELGRQLGFEVHVEPLATIDGRIVSSTKVRRALAEGDMAAASRMLGRPYTVTGRVIEGESRGRGFGYPTANIGLPPHKLLPAEGVYAGVALLRDGNAGPLPAAVNLGQAPTFGVSKPRLEAHLIDFRGDVYGERLTIGFLARLRGIETFGHLDQLLEQLQQDVADTRRIFADGWNQTEMPSP
jgi:riboflavin kinase/FMN adenylyltransferase